MAEPKTPFGVRSGLLLSGIGTGRTAAAQAGGPMPAGLTGTTSSNRRPPAAAEAAAAADLPAYLSAHRAATVARILDATRLRAERSAGAVVRARLEQDWLAERVRMLGPGSGSGSGAGAAASGEFAVIGMHAPRSMYCN